MNRLHLLVASSLVALTASGCGTSTKGAASDPNANDEQPVVNATANVLSGVAPLEVQFSGIAAGGDGALTYAWDFGDGETSSAQDPTHTYTGNGVFSAAFTATDEDGDFATATVTISVGSESCPAVTASADVTQGLAPLDVQFTATVVGGDAPVTVSWNFGDGETSAEVSPAHTFTTPGTYGATVTATDATGDEAQATVLITVGNDDKPVVAITANPTSGSAPLPVAFTASISGGNAPLTYAWTFGDGNTANTANANNTYMADGSYNAKLVVTDADGDAAEAQVTIVVNTQTTATDPDLRIGLLDVFASGLDDDYEPNDETAYYLGDYGEGNKLYTISDAYLDEVDVTWFADIVNFGAALSTPFDVDFYQNVASPGPAATQLGEQWETITNINANGTRRVYFTVTSAEPYVEFSSWVRADTFNEITEVDEDNNLSGPLQVMVLADEDWFAVYETSGYQLKINLENLPGDYDIELYNQAGSKLASSLNGGTTPEQILYTTTANGLYFIRVVGYEGARSSTQPYTLKVLVP